MEYLLRLIDVGEALAQKYDAVVTNPPYMGSSGMSGKLSDYVKKNYPDSKSDLFAVFIERCRNMTAINKYQAMITQHAWMFLSSFEKLRDKLQQIETINMAHLGPRAFEEIGGEVVQTTSFVLCNQYIPQYKGTYCRLIEPTTQDGKEELFLTKDKLFIASQDNFSKIPGSPVAYWVSDDFIALFGKTKVFDYAETREGLSPADNDRFLRFWFEIDNTKWNKKWFPYTKGGNYRKWYGNNDYVVNWENDGFEIKNNTDKATGRIRSHNYNGDYAFREGFTWTAISSFKTSFRYVEGGYLFDSAGSMGFAFDEKNLKYIIGNLNSKIVEEVFNFISPTIKFMPGQVVSVPCIINNDQKEYVTELVNQSIRISGTDWDSFETSWDFQHHPIVPSTKVKQEQLDSQFAQSRKAMFGLLSWHYDNWEKKCEERFNQLKQNEEELNRIFIDIYGLKDELTPEVDDKDVTVRKADLGRDIRSFISYAVGCMFGRYSLDIEGLTYAGGEWDAEKYKTFTADKDNIIPICDDEYFEDDIVGRFVDFVAVVYGKETLDENLKFIADALGGKGQPKDAIREYFIKDFYKDHCKIYQKRPIYWLFDSGKKGGFKCLIYMHRYQTDTIARIRTDYVHEQQARYRTSLADLETRIANADTKEKVKLNKQLNKVNDQMEEIRVYEEKIHHLADQMIDIDLDDGVKHNYAIFQDVLAKIK